MGVVVSVWLELMECDDKLWYALSWITAWQTYGEDTVKLPKIAAWVSVGFPSLGVYRYLVGGCQNGHLLCRDSLL